MLGKNQKELGEEITGSKRLSFKSISNVCPPHVVKINSTVRSDDGLLLEH